MDDKTIIEGRITFFYNGYCIKYYISKDKLELSQIDDTWIHDIEKPSIYQSLIKQHYEKLKAELQRINVFLNEE